MLFRPSLPWGFAAGSWEASAFSIDVFEQEVAGAGAAAGGNRRKK